MIFDSLSSALLALLCCSWDQLAQSLVQQRPQQRQMLQARLVQQGQVELVLSRSMMPRCHAVTPADPPSRRAVEELCCLLAVRMLVEVFA